MLEANVVCVNHKKYMVEPFVVHVIFVVYMNHVCLDHVVFCGSCVFCGLHEPQKNTWGRQTWFMWFFGADNTM